MPRPIRHLVAVLAVLLPLVLTGMALAGPWPREEGGVFLSVSTEQDRDDSRYDSIYAEYGLSPRNTLGLELGHTKGESSALIWWQRALDDGSGPNRWSISLGLGAIQRDGRTHPMGQIGTAWGRGFDSLPLLQLVPGGGWLALDTRFKMAAVTQEFDFGPNVIADETTYLTPESTSKAEATLGWHVSDRLMLINQFRFEDREDTGFSSKLAVSAVQDLVGPAKVELGLIEPLSGPGERAVKLGAWFGF
jgi:hypothetical protein